MEVEPTRQLINHLDEVETIQETYSVLGSLKGGTVPCRLMNSEADVHIPDFAKLNVNRKIGIADRVVDIVGKVEHDLWSIELAMGRLSRDEIQELRLLVKRMTVVGWMIFSNNLDHQLRTEGKQNELYLSGRAEWEEIKRILGLI